MVKPTALANAVTTVWGVAYTLCGLVTLISPDLFFGVVKTWFHGLNLDLVKSTEPFSLMSFIFGVVTFGVYIWVVTFAAASLYNNFSKKR